MLFKSFLKNKSYVFFALCISCFVFSCSEISDPKTEPKKKTGTQQVALKGEIAKNSNAQRILKGTIKTSETSYFKASVKAGKVEKGRLEFKFTYTYDNRGNKVGKKFHNPYDRRLGYESTYTYNDKGNPIEEKSSYPEGNLSVKYTYDGNDNLIEKRQYNSNGRLDWRSTYQYDDKGNLMQYNYYDPVGDLPAKKTYTYDDRGRKIGVKAYNDDGSLSYASTFTYDDRGNQTGVKHYDSDGSLESVSVLEYKYDSEGNWIERVWFNVRGKIKRARNIEERKITYY